MRIFYSTVRTVHCMNLLKPKTSSVQWVHLIFVNYMNISHIINWIKLMSMIMRKNNQKINGKSWKKKFTKTNKIHNRITGLPKSIFLFSSNNWSENWIHKKQKENCADNCLCITFFAADKKFQLMKSNNKTSGEKQNRKSSKRCNFWMGPSHQPNIFIKLYTHNKNVSIF